MGSVGLKQGSINEVGGRLGHDTAVSRRQIIPSHYSNVVVTSLRIST